MKFPEEFRVINAGRFSSQNGNDFGLFRIPTHKAPDNRELQIIATAGAPDSGPTGEWEHVSVSIVSGGGKCPSWNAMCFVKSLFWDDEECVVQFHPAKSNYVNMHSGCLHLWRSKTQAFPTPPTICV
jgi:hypothetical protein